MPIAISLLLSLALVATAQDADQMRIQSGNPLAGIGLIFAIFCIVRRKQPIGGWLLYFFWQIFAGLAAWSIEIATSPEVFTPSGWAQSHLYLIFISTRTTEILLYAILCIASVMLIRTSEWEWVLRIRYILIGVLIADGLRLGLDSAFLPSLVVWDSYSLLLPAIFLPYFFRSKRVFHVFKLKDWAIPDASYLDLTPQKGVVYTESELRSMAERKEAINGNGQSPTSSSTPD